MQFQTAYLGRSQRTRDGALQFAPNLARDPVAFDAALTHPLRFREAISALHAVVVSDHRFQKRDKTAYREWKAAEAARRAALHREVHQRSRDEILAAAQGAVDPDLERFHRDAVRKYWRARDRYSRHLFRSQPRLWWILDPVITVAEDGVLFEAFSQDESSYGCLHVDRAAGFGEAPGARAGTTNVDYSWDLYEHFQGLRTYRETRFRIDPQGFEVETEGHADLREEKVDLPTSWLRGFMQLQAGMVLPKRRVPLGREAVYSVLAWLRRHRETTGPRALRFELTRGQPPAVVLEPWDTRVVSHGTTYDGPDSPPIRVWGRRRLAALERVLPLARGVEVHLLGSGLPSFWVVDMGEMRFTLALSGWTTNDWAGGAALELLAPPVEAGADLVDRVAAALRARATADLDALCADAGCAPGEALAALRRLAHAGQVLPDLATGTFRWRSILSRRLGEKEIGPEDPELVAHRDLLRRGEVVVESDDEGPKGQRLLAGSAATEAVDLTLDADGVIRRGSCGCSHHRKAGIRRGPCRHLLALRAAALGGPSSDDGSNDTWFDRLRDWAGDR